MNRWLFQLAAWQRNAVFYGLLFLVVIGFNWPGLQELLKTQPDFLWRFLGFYTFCYLLCWVHNWGLYERLFRRQRYGAYLLGCAGTLSLWTVACGLTDWRRPTNWLNIFFSGLLVMLFGWGLYLIYHVVFRAQQQLRNDLASTHAELALLRAQLNPHFLFNALNNLYGVSVSTPDRVPEYVVLLSELLRYQIESSRQHRVSLAEELHFIDQFVRYEREKLGNRGQVTWLADAPRTVLRIAPLLLSQFVENAFKYGGQLAHPVVSIEATLAGNELRFHCRNTFNARLRAATTSTKTGLANTRQRLALQYPHHTLTIQESDSVFDVHLCLTLSHDES
ncbi:histidine kinase [Hymenobacter sp. BT664]|uniref:Histidine kinase n=1 Tax=Hymenobacter montanus TaxID=2771359 RepID=A0A927BD02_9BACT|nr:histidine kinase [Hymenobacter montanus]MBD2768531.1 histidine kinase [Hymenobacter montanus]